MRRANGTGSIFKLKGKRRKPYRVRVTMGYVVDTETGKCKQIVKDIGCFSNKKEAEIALAEYLNCPYDLTKEQLTFGEVVEKWKEDYFETLNGVSSKRTVEAALRYCSSLNNMRMKDIRAGHLKDCIKEAYVISTTGKDKGQKRYASASTKGRMKSVFNLIFDWAEERDIVDKNYARLFGLDSNIKKKQEEDKKEAVPFSQEEIKLLWDNVTRIPFVDMVLIEIYSGWRPQELAILKLKDIDLTEEMMFGGLKTDAGKNRAVPIHPLVKELVVKRYNEAQEMGSEYLFNDLDGQQGTYMTYDKYRRRFEKVINRLGMKHRPHETRHTFITKAKKAGIDEYIIKRIVGHSIHDLTERTYTHRDFEELREGMRKIPR